MSYENIDFRFEITPIPAGGELPRASLIGDAQTEKLLLSGQWALFHVLITSTKGEQSLTHYHPYLPLPATGDEDQCLEAFEDFLDEDEGLDYLLEAWKLVEEAKSTPNWAK